MEPGSEEECLSEAVNAMWSSCTMNTSVIRCNSLFDSGASAERNLDFNVGIMLAFFFCFGNVTVADFDLRC